jgi:hypothetical protein
VGNKGDIVLNALEFGALAVDRIDLELSAFLNFFLPVGGQGVDRQA